MPPKSHRGEDLSFVNTVKNVWVAVALIGFIHSGQIGETAQKASIFYHSVSLPSKIRYVHKTEDLRYAIFAVSPKKTSAKEHFYPDVRRTHVQTKEDARDEKRGWGKKKERKSINSDAHKYFRFNPRIDLRSSQLRSHCELLGVTPHAVDAAAIRRGNAVIQAPGRVN